VHVQRQLPEEVKGDVMRPAHSHIVEEKAYVFSLVVCPLKRWENEARATVALRTSQTYPALSPEFGFDMDCRPAHRWGRRALQFE